MPRGGRPLKWPMNYYEIEVILFAGTFLPEDWSPGRVFAVPGRYPMLELALTIDSAFGRWDLVHERVFTVKGKQFDGDSEVKGADRLTLDSLGLARGDIFEYEFDLGDSWIHRCLVLNAAPDLYKQWDGWRPEVPSALFGWGSLPDQYGREADTDDGPVDE
jgi:Plasmid pRiA4b ORF-3-like protein